MSLLMLAGGALFFCAGGAAGWFLGIALCERQYRCIRRQRHVVEDWTGGLTQRMQERLAKRARAHGAVPDPSDDQITENIRPPRPKKDPQ